MSQFVFGLLEKNRIPDFLIRAGIRGRLSQQLVDLKKQHMDDEQDQKMQWVGQLRQSPVALVPEKANEQHYEVSSEFFEIVLGKHLKYSCGYWPEGVRSLDDSETAMLELTVARADLQDGQDVLELGCGWGSLTLFMGAKYPKSKITAVSNSNSQREFIMQQAKLRGLANVNVITADMNDFSTDGQFDRVVSIEMFEHMRNYQELLGRVSRWLKSGGKLFVHVFCHKEFSYPFVAEREDDWMAKNFFAGGLMPSKDLLLYFQDELHIQNHWMVDGRHYQKTCEAWLKELDANKSAALKILGQGVSQAEAIKRFSFWRVFFLACAETFGYDGGKEWFVTHYLFEKP